MWHRTAKTHDDYKKVFCTLYRLANLARKKFGFMPLEEASEIDWPELREEVREECSERETYLEEMAGWSFDRVDEVFLC
jgi:hypothetical protein